MSGRPARPFRVATAVIAAAILVPGIVRAQGGTVAVERENFRAAPSGTVLAEVLRGTRLGVGEVRERWREATLEGWIWAASGREETRDGHDLVVSASRGENLRAAPNGAIIARLRAGMRLDRVEARDAWIRVRRGGWIWEPSLEVEPVPPAATTRSTAVAAPEAAVVDASSAGAAREWAQVGGGGIVVLENPSGDTLSRVRAGATVEVLAREGDWTRVRVEGWTFTAGLAEPDSTGALLKDVPTSELKEQPERWRGRVVEWNVQFIALQQAEQFRTDLLEGEPFMLMRGPDEEPGFVYVAVPPDRLEEVRALSPLERVRVVGRIRTVASSLTGSPVLDLLELRPSGR